MARRNVPSRRSGGPKQNTFFGGAAILAASSLLVKGIGALFRIPLGNILPDEVMGDYNAAYNIYNFFLTISTAGLPVALSKTISEANTLGRRNQVDKIFRVAFTTFLTLGLISFFCMTFLSRQMADIVISNPKVSRLWPRRCCAYASSPPSGASSRATLICGPPASARSSRPGASCFWVWPWPSGSSRR